MKEFKYVVTDPEGIHARPAGMLVKAVKEFSCDIKIAKDGKAMNCKAIFGIMGLAVKQGEEVTLTFDGADEDAAYEVIGRSVFEKLSETKKSFLNTLRLSGQKIRISRTKVEKTYADLSGKKRIFRHCDRKDPRIQKE